MVLVHGREELVWQQDFLLGLQSAQRSLAHPDGDVGEGSLSLRFLQPVLHEIPVAVVRHGAVRTDGCQKFQLTMICSVCDCCCCGLLELQCGHVTPDPLIEQQIGQLRRDLRGRGHIGSSSSDPGM